MGKYAIEKIHISEFRRFSDFELEMRPFMVLIGPNGIGKTSFLDAVEELYRDSISIDRYHIIDVSKGAPVRLPQEMKTVSSPGNNGEALIPYLNYLYENYPNKFETLIDTIVPIFPNFESLDFKIDENNKLSLIWNETDTKKPLNEQELSDGTIRFLWLLALLYSPNLSEITMIEEPELSMHPDLLLMLVEVMRETSMSTQLIVTTQSSSMLRLLSPNEVVVMDFDEDDNSITTATWADTMNLDHWLEDFGFDEIWHMGVIGGRA